MAASARAAAYAEILTVSIARIKSGGADSGRPCGLVSSRTHLLAIIKNRHGFRPAANSHCRSEAR
jgi:hypothetical protein